VAQPHERGGAAAEHAQAGVAQMAEQQRQRNSAPLARTGQPLQVRPGNLIRTHDDDGRGRVVAAGHLDGQPLDRESGQDLGAGAPRGGFQGQAGVVGRLDLVPQAGLAARRQPPQREGGQEGLMRPNSALNRRRYSGNSSAEMSARSS
jgi:hypothetical protein